MKAPKPPPAPNAAATVAMQQGANVASGTAQQGMNMTNQYNPIGSKSFQQIGVNPDGTPRYGMTEQFNPEQQALLDQLVGSKGNVGGAGQNLSADAFSTYSEMPDFGVGIDSRVTAGMDRAQPYFERFQAPARAQLDTALRNQGILPTSGEGKGAYEQQMDKMLAQQDLDKGNWLNTFQKQAFDQSVQEYQIPEQMIERLMAAGAPMGLKESFGETPQVQFNAPNAIVATGQAYDAQFKNYQEKVARQNMLTNLGMTAASTAMNVAAPGSGTMMSSIFGPSGYPTSGVSSTPNNAGLPWQS